MSKPMKIALLGNVPLFEETRADLRPESEVIENMPEYVTQRDPNRRIKGHGNYKGFIPNNPKRRRK